MKENTEIAKIDYQNAAEAMDIYDNPVVKAIREMLSGNLNFVGTTINNGIGTKLQERQKSKEKAFLEAVFADGTITLDDIQDVDFLFEFAMAHDAIKHLLQNEKITFFANLLKNTALNPARNTNTFQEELERLCSLSYREIEMLLLLRNCQKEYFKERCKTNNEDIQDAINIWDIYLDKTKEEFGLPDEMIESIFASIERTGFCKVTDVLYPGATAKCYSTSLYFEEFCYDITHSEDKCFSNGTCVSK